MESESLFRREAVEAQSVTLGGVIAHTTPGFIPIAALLSLTLVFAIAMLVLFEVPKVIRISGWVQPDSGFVHLAARDNGFVSEIGVEEGDEVKAGDFLARINGDSTGAPSQTVNERILERFEERRVLIDRASAQGALAAEQREAARAAELGELQAELGMLEALILIQNQLVAVSQDQLEQAEALLDRGSGSLLQVQTRQRLLLEARAEEERMRGIRAQLTANEATLSARNQAEALALLQEQALLRDQAIEVEIAALEAQQRAGFALTAPEDGQVVSIVKTEGSSVMTGDRILTILPHFEGLEVHALLPVFAIGSVEPGNRIMMRFDAAAGGGEQLQLKGVVSFISQAPIDARNFDGPLSADGRFHRLIAEIDEGDESLIDRLKPGMTLQATVTYRREPLWRALFLSEV